MTRKNLNMKFSDKTTASEISIQADFIRDSTCKFRWTEASNPAVDSTYISTFGYLEFSPEVDVRRAQNQQSSRIASWVAI